MCPASVKTSRRSLETGEAKLWALLIGVNQYADDRLPALAYSALDCQGLGETLLVATRAFPQKSVMVHHDYAARLEGGVLETSGQARSLPNQVGMAARFGLGTVAKLRSFPAKLPQREAIQASLQTIVQSAQPQDTVLFYFSGHGLWDAVSQQVVLCLAETDRDVPATTGLGIAELLQVLNQCQAHQQLVWLDACHSGGLSFRSPALAALPNPMPQLVQVLQQQAARSQGFYALLSCDQNQLSWEFPELGHGVFTYYLMRGLLGEAADSQGRIEADALYKYVYYQTLRYIDKTNQQLRLINQQKRGRGEMQLQSEYPLQTPKRIVEGIGELVIGLKSDLAEPPHPRQALVVEGLLGSSIALALGQVLGAEGRFELTYCPQSARDWESLRSTLQTRLQIDPDLSASFDSTHSATLLLYLRGKTRVTAAGESSLVLRQAELSRSWLRQTLRQSPIARQVVILDCPGATDLQDWIDDLQIGAERGQCLIAVASPAANPDWFAQVLLDSLNAADKQAGLTMAGWIAQLQLRAAEAGVTPHIWLSGSQGVIEVLPGQMGTRGDLKAFDLGICPYLGLRAFAEEDAPFFFGREALVQQMIQALVQQSVLAVVGASGSGKSSLVQAGLLAQLRQGQQIPGSETWWLGSLRPGERPLIALAEALTQGSTTPSEAAAQLEGILYQGVESLVYWLRSRLEPMLVLVVDQFEELFTLAPLEDRQQFLELLFGAIQHAGDRFKLVITLRSDFMAPCLEFPQLAQVLQQSSLLVPPTLSLEDYRAIMVRPAEKVGLTVEPELVEVLLQELSHTAADLPLLEFVLEQLWEQRQPGLLSLQVYQQQIGGLKGALERKAQALYDSFDAHAQACARWIFLTLTQLGEGTEDTRRRVNKAALTVPKYSAAVLEQTLEALATAKLIILDQAEPVQPPDAVEPAPSQKAADPPIVTVEVAHEILIRHWSTLRWWLEENRSRLRAQRQIEQAAQQWHQSSQQTDFLLRGVRLDAAEELYVNYTDELSTEVQQFIEAGLAERERDQRQIKRRLRQTQIAVGLIGSLGIAAAGFGGFAYLQRQQAQLNQVSTLNALSESQFLANQQLEALTTGLQAGRQLQHLFTLGLNSQQLSAVQTQTAATLQQAVEQTQERNRLEGHGQQVNTVAVRPDGEQFASGSDDGTVKLWQPDGQLIRTLTLGERVTQVAFHPNDGTLAVATAKGQVSLWSPQGEKIRELIAGDWITSLTFSPDGRWLATGSRDRMVKLWQTQDGRLLRTLTGATGFVNAVAFSPNAEQIAAASEDGTIRLWNPATGVRLRTLTGHQGRVTAVAFNPAGVLASAGEDRTVRLWNLSDGSSTPLTGHTGAVTQVQFSRDGNWLLSTSADETIKLWKSDGMPIATLKGHGAAVLSASFSPDHREILSGSADKTVRFWDIASFEQPRTPIETMSLSPDGQLIATADWTGAVQIRQRQSMQELKSWKPDAGPIAALDFSVDGQRIATSGETGLIKIWDLQGRLLQTLSGHKARITSLRFSPDGQWLASASDDRTVRLWRASDGQFMHTLSGHQDSVSVITWSPDSQILASGSYDSTIRLWRTDGTLLQTLSGHKLAVAALVFSPDGATLASGSWDNTIRLWQVRDGTLLHTLTGHQDGITQLAVRADGRILASGSADQTLKLWNLADGSLNKTLAGAGPRMVDLDFTAEGSLISAGESGLQVWDLQLAELQTKGCAAVHDYRQTTEPNPVCD